jgi:hypothetical protein
MPPPRDQGGGVYELTTPVTSLFITEKNGWAFLVREQADLAKVPDDPTSLLGGLNENYDVAIRGSIKNIPEMWRQMAMAPVKMGIAMGKQRRPGESDEEYAIRTKLADNSLKQMDTLINEIDEVLVGFAVDQSSGTCYLDWQMTAVEGTKTARQFAEATPPKTDFAGFDVPGAAITANWTGELTDDDVTQAKAYLSNVRATALKELEGQGLSADEVTLATKLLTDAMDVVEQTIDAKKADAGLVLLLDTDQLELVIGGTIADGAKLEGVVKQLAKVASTENPEFAQALKLDDETHQGVRFHTLAIPTEELGDPGAVELFGPTLNVVLGIGEKSVYLAAGRDPAGTLKQVIDKSKAEPGKDVPPMRLSVALVPIVKFARQINPDDEVLSMIDESLGQTTGQDHVTLTATLIENGVKMRLELEQGVLKALGSQMGGPGGEMPPDGGF